MRQRGTLLGFLGIAVAASGCAPYLVVVDPLVPDPNSVTQQALQDFMRSEERPSIVLRVPSPQLRVTESQGPQGEVEWNQGYNLIERELVRAGFTVRDRALLEAVLRSNQDLDYSVIQQKIDAQLILEITGIFVTSYNNDQYRRVAEPNGIGILNGVFYLEGWQFECRAILVESGEVGGIYTIHVAPRENVYLVESNNTTHYFEPEPSDGEPGLTADGGRGYILPFETAVPRFVQELIFELKPWTSGMY